MFFSNCGSAESLRRERIEHHKTSKSVNESSTQNSKEVSQFPLVFYQIQQIINDFDVSYNQISCVTYYFEFIYEVSLMQKVFPTKLLIDYGLHDQLLFFLDQNIPIRTTLIILSILCTFYLKNEEGVAILQSKGFHEKLLDVISIDIHPLIVEVVLYGIINFYYFRVIDINQLNEKINRIMEIFSPIQSDLIERVQSFDSQKEYKEYLNDITNDPIVSWSSVSNFDITIEKFLKILILNCKSESDLDKYMNFSFTIIEKDTLGWGNLLGGYRKLLIKRPDFGFRMNSILLESIKCIQDMDSNSRLFLKALRFIKIYFIQNPDNAEVSLNSDFFNFMILSLDRENEYVNCILGNLEEIISISSSVSTSFVNSSLFNRIAELSFSDVFVIWIQSTLLLSRLVLMLNDIQLIMKIIDTGFISRMEKCDSIDNSEVQKQILELLLCIIDLSKRYNIIEWYNYIKEQPWIEILIEEYSQSESEAVEVLTIELCSQLNMVPMVVL